MESRRRAQTKDELNLVGNKEAREIEVAKNKELKRQAKKIRKKQDYRIIEISSCKFCHA